MAEPICCTRRVYSLDYLIVYNNESIGKVVAPVADEFMGVIHGSFVPFPPYE